MASRPFGFKINFLKKFNQKVMKIPTLASYFYDVVLVSFFVGAL
jgi:hypothetical protein